MAAIARTRLAYREAAEQYLGAAKVVTEIDPREEWRYLSECASVLRLLGDEFGDNAALTEAIKIFSDDVLPRALSLSTERDVLSALSDHGI